MIGILGIVLSLALLIWLAYRGWNVIFIAPFCATVALLFNWGDAPLLATYTQTFMPALGNYFAKFFPLFMLGAVFGKLMDDSGSARAIAHKIVGVVGKERSMLAVVLACAILTYGGVSLFVVAFSVYPIAVSLFREADIPKRLIPAAIGLGSFTFTMTALPGTPAIQNAIPMPFFGTNTFAAPGLGIVAALFMFTFGQLWLNRRMAQARSRNEGYGDHDDMLAGGAKAEMPSFWLALLPIVVVIALNYVATNFVIPALDTSYLATPKFKNTPLSAVLGIWAIILAMLVAIVIVALLNRHRIANLLDTFNKGTMGSLLPMANVASEVAYGAVIASLAAFAIVRESLKSVASDPVTSLFIVVTVLAGMTGSASGGMSLALGAMGEYYAHAAQAAGVNPEIMHRIAALGSAAMDILPHNGAVITLLAICSLTHRESYLDLFVVGSLSALLASVVVLVLNALFGTF
ncbi:H+/gluconate symporter-like permease [Plasticicumulans lactativorans]|uniref:H+/gluconate symporter-like permease n=1 Tax=Plasticicumulans lactativorans TaxID=1133106 RepID=A0A4R2LJM4_9GAMM|nr:GntP family permease [Plasticicumulans lactativorans]TCO83426.1 H+/gluconate symporter-like permease [Plasticicumulans lactativorans]